MQHTINNHIDSDQIELIRTLKGTTLQSIFSDDIGEFALTIVMVSSRSELVIKNVPVIEADGDEYPKLTIEKASAEEGRTYRHVPIGKNVHGIQIIRDEVVWQRGEDTWIVSSDIGIKIILENQELLLLAHDSLAGFIKMVTLKGKQVDLEHEALEEYWSMKTDQIQLRNRIELMI